MHKIGTARWPLIKTALINISKSANRINTSGSSFAQDVEFIALRLETTASHMRTLSSELSGDEPMVTLTITHTEARSIVKACAEQGAFGGPVSAKWLALANKIKSKTPE